jgi:tRNA(His) guanylyltransferase
MSNKLNERIIAYQQATDIRLLPRVPIIIVVNGRSFSKITSLLEKPFDKSLSECLLSTMMKLCADIEGALFSYQHNDEIVVVARNDQNNTTEPWFDNRAQKIASITSSIATLHFNRCVSAIDLNLMGEVTFHSQVFAVPNITEAINTLIYKQQYNFQTSIQAACFYELLKKYDKNIIKNMISGLSIDERIDLLNQESQINFNDYPISFRRGAACYKVPRVSEDGNMKNKWFVNPDLPIFTKDQTFLSSIFKNGADIFRQESF